MTALAEKIPTLTAHDRCDRCIAQANVCATMPSGSSVYLCSHHGRRFEPKLREQGAVLYDAFGLVSA